jgi:PAS domain S-box-containing protein
MPRRAPPPDPDPHLIASAAPSERPLHWITAFALTAVSYALAGLAALGLAIPPGYASPLHLAAGIALASVLVFGGRMLPAVWLGAFAVNLGLGFVHTPVIASMLPLPLVISAGAMLQAFAGAALVKRFVARPITLSEPRDVALFVAAAMLSCVVCTSVGNLALWLSHRLPTAQLPASLGTWWVGDVLGVLIAVPVVLTLVGQPRDAWAPRRLSVGLTLALTTLLLAAGIRQLVQWSNERVRTAFDHQAASASQAIVAQLREPLMALEAMHGLFVASDDVTADEMQLATRAWLTRGGLQVIGWSERIRGADVPAFEARVRAAGLPQYHVFDRPDMPPLPEPREEVVAVRLIEPFAPNAAALGVNVLSIPPTRAAVEIARRSGHPAATAAFRLTQQVAGADELGVVVYQALYTPLVPAEAQRAASLRGLVSVVMRMDEALKPTLAQMPPQLALCLIDVTPGGPAQRLAGALGCEVQTARQTAAQTAGLQHVRLLDYAQRQWRVQISAVAGGAGRFENADVWLFALMGLLSAAMLGGFQLIVTDRTRRIETAVRERTAALQGEVHERELAQGRLRDSQQRFRNILNHVPIGVIYTDLRGNVKQTNPRFCQLTGYGEDELLRLSLADYTHPDDLGEDTAMMAQLVRGDIPMYRRHKRYIAKHGATVWVQATVSLLRDSKGKPRSIVGVVEDITEHLKLEEAERAREAAEASNRAKSEFLSRMSHELRTPLNAMLGFAQLLELDTRHPLAPEQQPWVGQIQQAGWHLLEMINDVLDLSRIESGNLRLQLQALHLAELIDASVAMVSRDAQRRGITISQDADPRSDRVLGDATRVKQIMTNLLSNAVKYNTDGGRIHIASRGVGADVIEVTVTDTGLGLTPKQLAELFQPFNRLGRERTALQGTGIGLVISQRLAELMGGTLRAHSAAGQGSAFVLTLPCSNGPDTVPSDLDALAPQAADYHRRQVHYVEDNETNVEVMRGILAQRPQVEMQVSLTGLEGLAAIHAQRPDLILLDMNLPDISGMELLHRLKADERTEDIPVVIVSADALAQQIDEAFRAGCAHYLTKPVNVAELLAVVDALLEQIDTRYG